MHLVERTAQPQECFVNGVDLGPHGHPGQQPHDPRRHFAVQLVVAGTGCEPDLVGGGLEFEPRVPKRDAQVLGLLTHGDTTAVII